MSHLPCGEFMFNVFKRQRKKKLLDHKFFYIIWVKVDIPRILILVLIKTLYILVNAPLLYIKKKKGKKDVVICGVS